MDIDHADIERSPDQTLARPGDVLPRTIPILAQENRPFFPGLALPVVMPAESSAATLARMQEREERIVGLVMSKGTVNAETGARDLHGWGTACRVHKVQQHEGQLHILLEGLRRFRVTHWVSESAPLVANVEYHPEDEQADSDDVKAYAVAIINTIKEMVPLNPLYGEELKMFLARSNPNEASKLADFAASLTSASREELQEVLETVDLGQRLGLTLELINRELHIARAQGEIREHVESEMQSHQREYLLREQLKFIQKDLGITKDEKTAEADRFRERLEGLTLPEAAASRIDEELDKFSMLEPASAEYGVSRNYLDWLTTLPWGRETSSSLDIGRARKVLDSHHEGLEDAKGRILEFLAVEKMRGEASGSIILFVGPPGVGKTSLGQAIADAMGREFYRFSLGGMRDEAEIKGHRRTYVGAMPGKFIQALRHTETSNPVIMLDEIDKVGASYQGDPAAALLEVLDPEQNASFQDHYLDVPFDLSRVLFICTANQLDTIPAPLLDRMEEIHLSGYLAEEKLEIATRHLLPRQLKAAGIADRKRLRIDKAAMRTIIDGYAREAGVRRLEKRIGQIVRKATLRLLEDEDLAIRVKKADVADYLGQPLFSRETPLRGVGVVTGLAWTAMGGATLSIEATAIEAAAGSLKVTGQLGDIMQESAQIAWTYARANAAAYGADPAWFDKHAIHLHVPAGATPKDGPSAGVTMATALLSLAGGRRPRPVAMTGELTLTGQVFPVGGIREKLLAARRSGIRTVVLPAPNERDVEEIPESVYAGIEIHYAQKYEDVAAVAFS